MLSASSRYFLYIYILLVPIRVLFSLWVVAEQVELLGGVAPVLIDLDEGLEVDALAEELLEALAGFGGNFLECLALMADDDALLRVALDIDDGVDVDVGLVFLEALHTDLDAVGDLLVVVEEYLLADDLRDEELGGLVCQLVLVEVWRTLGQEFLDACQDGLHVEPVQRRYGQNLRLGQNLMPLLHERDQILLVGQVNLVDEHEHGHFHLRDLLQEIGVLVDLLHRVGHIEQHVGIDQRTLAERQHGLLQLVVGFQHAGRVRKHNLGIVVVDDAHDAMACGLRLEGGNGNTLTNQKVHERRFSDVGITNDIYKTRFMHRVLSWRTTPCGRWFLPCRTRLACQQTCCRHSPKSCSLRPM